jgi:RNA polymerase sigma-70 factor (ECF subfamily)
LERLLRTGRDTRGLGSREETFSLFVGEAQDRIRQALTAGFGAEVGRDAAEEALVYAWQHWDRVGGMANPAGYVYRVGHRIAQKMATAQRRPVVFPEIEVSNPIRVEPGLPAALSSLSAKQRAVVVTVHGYGLSQREAAELLGMSRASLRRHLERALERLRKALGVTADD